MISIVNARRVSFSLLCAVTLSILSGCSLLKNVFMSKQAREKEQRKQIQAQIEQYAASRDQEKLEQFCMNKKIDYTNQKRACNRLADIRVEDFEKSSCQQISERFTALKQFVRKYAGRRQFHTMFYKSGAKLAQCKQWDDIFTSLMHWGNREKMGAILLSNIDRSVESSEEHLLAWLKKQDSPFSFKDGAYAARNAMHYLLEKKSFSHCGAFSRLASRSTPLSKTHFIYYFEEAGCKNAVHLIIPQLSSDTPSYRSQACRVLGKLGTAKIIPKLRILSYTDPAFFLRRRNHVAYRFYHVRSACLSAIGKIQLRSQ